MDSKTKEILQKFSTQKVDLANIQKKINVILFFLKRQFSSCLFIKKFRFFLPPFLKGAY